MYESGSAIPNKNSIPINSIAFFGKVNELYTVTRYFSKTVASKSPVRLMYEKKKKNDRSNLLSAAYNTARLYDT